MRFSIPFLHNKQTVSLVSNAGLGMLTMCAWSRLFSYLLGGEDESGACI